MPPRRRPKPSPAKGEPLSKEERAHFREVAAEWKAEQARLKAEQALRKLPGKTFVERPSGALGGKGFRLLRAVVGKDLFELAEGRFTPDLLARAAGRINEARRRTERERVKALSKLSTLLEGKGFSPSEIARYRQRARPRYRVPLIQHAPIRSGPNRGKWKQYKRVGRRNVFVKIIKSRAGVKRARIAHLKRTRAAKIAETLGIQYNDARQLVREVEVQALKDLSAFKKTRTYRELPRRKQQAYTERRWKAGSVAVLYALADVEGYT